MIKVNMEAWHGGQEITANLNPAWAIKCVLVHRVVQSDIFTYFYPE